jgi:hypothetical protein
LLDSRTNFAQVDVYSYGIIMWELATRQTPWDELGELEYLQLSVQIELALKNDRRPTVPASIVAEHSGYAVLHPLLLFQRVTVVAIVVPSPRQCILSSWNLC